MFARRVLTKFRVLTGHRVDGLKGRFDLPLAISLNFVKVVTNFSYQGLTSLPLCKMSITGHEGLSVKLRHGVETRFFR